MIKCFPVIPLKLAVYIFLVGGTGFTLLLIFLLVTVFILFVFFLFVLPFASIFFPFFFTIFFQVRIIN
ncbi:hypothetical protein HanXRQr2_Chr01g0033641 [Helianthus annuus]|uniref:Uncharacterized protein n=1 Tax=Helianthus annuus TaxID=4232 RepID=A0A9K3JYE0_HELAN|nr:hypothetical protein HanXRQr2_Chr01g0033641 [Helianthus annuus]